MLPLLTPLDELSAATLSSSNPSRPTSLAALIRTRSRVLVLMPGAAPPDGRPCRSARVLLRFPHPTPSGPSGRAPAVGPRQAASPRRGSWLGGRRAGLPVGRWSCDLRAPARDRGRCPTVRPPERVPV